MVWYVNSAGTLIWRAGQMFSELTAGDTRCLTEPRIVGLARSAGSAGMDHVVLA